MQQPEPGSELQPELHLQVRFPVTVYQVIARAYLVSVLIDGLPEFGDKHKDRIQIIAQMGGIAEATARERRHIEGVQQPLLIGVDARIVIVRMEASGLEGDGEGETRAGISARLRKVISPARSLPQRMEAVVIDCSLPLPHARSISKPVAEAVMVNRQDGLPACPRYVSFLLLISVVEVHGHIPPGRIVSLKHPVHSAGRLADAVLPPRERE